MADIIEAILHAFWEIIGYRTMRIIVPLISFGKARVESKGENITHRYVNGVLVIKALTASFIFWITIALIVITVIVIQNYK